MPLCSRDINVKSLLFATETCLIADIRHAYIYIYVLC